MKPVVAINRDIEGVPCITPKLEPGIDQALAHLEMLGHSSVAFLAGPSGSWMNSARRRVLQTGAPARGMTISEIGPSQPTIEGGRSTLARVIASRATAVIAFNDLMAIGLLQAAGEQDIPVPGAFSIVGFDDIFGSDFTSPALTTVRSPLADAGEIAVDRALEQIGSEGTGRARKPVDMLETELIIRGSTGVARS